MSKPVVLCISASDSGGGAGMQQDVRFVHFAGGRVACALTALTVQGRRGVECVDPVALDLLESQIVTALRDWNPAAVKIGALCSVGQVDLVAHLLSKARVPVVVDPVFSPTTGLRFLNHDALPVFRQAFLRTGTVVTPNIEELALLCGLSDNKEEDVVLDAGQKLSMDHGCTVYVTGGHSFIEQNQLVEWIFMNGRRERITRRRLVFRDSHGTGCAFSSALATGLARGELVQPAAARAAELVAGYFSSL